MDHKEIEDAAWEIKSTAERSPTKIDDADITKQVQRMKAAGLRMNTPAMRDLFQMLSYHINNLKAFAPSAAPDQGKLLSGLRKTCDAIVKEARRADGEA